jgi:hypothetical protein
MSQIAIEKVSITTSGSAGAAVGTSDSIPIMGFLLDVFLDYHASAPATTDVTIGDVNFGTFVVQSDNEHDVWLAPRKATCDVAAAATGLYDLIPLNGPVTITIGHSDALTDCVVVTLRWLTP